MIASNGDDKHIKIGEKTAMTNLKPTPRRRLRSFGSLTKHIDKRELRPVIEETQPQRSVSATQTDKTMNLGYLIMSVPKDLTYQEKIERLSEVADTVTAVEGSDVMVFSMWVPTE
jgi:hypothetical protein